ncbi:MAG TPA: transposase [Pseudorhodoferax sp.]|nr:transposase [Pseudorhodoferax sp.]
MPSLLGLARLVVVICLASGAVLDAAIGPHQGKGTGEISLVRQVLHSFRPGDVMLADALYCKLPDCHFDGCRRGRLVRAERRAHHRLSAGPLVGHARPHRALAQAGEPPEVDDARAVRARARGDRLARMHGGPPGVGHHAVRAPARQQGDLSRLFARRWNVELDLRNLKTTTGMDVLRCQTPEMNDKQLWAHLLAYNVIRLLMAQAASTVGTLSS